MSSMSFEARTAFKALSPLVRDDSIRELSSLLATNHALYHCFFNARGMHNHLAHQLIADVTLGATPADLRAHMQYQRDHYLGGFNLSRRERYDPHTTANLSVPKITDDNWGDHLGRPSHYWTYLHFFEHKLQERGMGGVLEEYVFSAEANEGGREMLSRWYGGVLHAAIHFGYAVETDVVGVAAEAMAMAAVTAARHTWLTPHDWLMQKPRAQKSLLELVGEVQADDRVGVDALGLREADTPLVDEPFEKGGRAHGVVHEYIDAWNVSDASQASSEVALLAALMLGAVPLKDDAYHHDFFL